MPDLAHHHPQDHRHQLLHRDSTSTRQEMSLHHAAPEPTTPKKTAASSSIGFLRMRRRNGRHSLNSASTTPFFTMNGAPAGRFRYAVRRLVAGDASRTAVGYLSGRTCPVIEAGSSDAEVTVRSGDSQSKERGEKTSSMVMFTSVHSLVMIRIRDYEVDRAATRIHFSYASPSLYGALM